MKTEINYPEYVINFLNCETDNSIEQDLESEVWLDFMESVSIKLYLSFPFKINNYKMDIYLIILYKLNIFP